MAERRRKKGRKNGTGCTTSSALLCVPAQATLLNPSYELQLEAWLGQGPLEFTNIFTKTEGSTSYDFHAAADGQGATFVLMNVFGGGQLGGTGIDLPSQIVGGYNPLSWRSSGDRYNYSYNDIDRTAFLFNLTSSTIQRQNLAGEGYFGSGVYQTVNAWDWGPGFGGGYDLCVEAFDFSYRLSGGYAYNYSFGGTSYGEEIVFGGPNCIAGTHEYSFFEIGELEVYTFAPAGGGNVPDSAGTLSLCGFALAGLAALRRRFQR